MRCAVIAAAITCFAALGAGSLRAAGAHSAAASQSQSIYSSTTIWEWEASQAADHWNALVEQCGVEPIQLNPDDPRDAGCVVRAMRGTGASPDAVQLFEMSKLFLLAFEERGTVDSGVASAPWFNMGRPQTVLLNGTPSVISIFNLLPSDWQAEPGYAAYEGALAWPEYSRLQESQVFPDGSQRLLISVVLRACRACPDLALMPLALTFDNDGVLTAITPLQPTSA